MAGRRIAISLGDPCGIGPEVVARALAARPDLDVVVYGDAGVLARAAGVAGVAAPAADRIRAVTALGPGDVPPGKPNDEAGRAQLAYLAAATTAALAGEVAALVTAPISKQWIARAGFTFPGHTEYLAVARRRARVRDDAGGTEAARDGRDHARARCATCARLLTADGIASTIWLTAEALARRFGIAAPRVAVAGLNPHAGEAGRFGDEEERLVRPAIETARARRRGRRGRRGLRPARARRRLPRGRERRASTRVVALYHDQGLIPLKLLHFDEGVNVTLGLPFVRTSPDHGTAYDIAGSGRAAPKVFWPPSISRRELAVDGVTGRSDARGRCARNSVPPRPARRHDR